MVEGVRVVVFGLVLGLLGHAPAFAQPAATEEAAPSEAQAEDAQATLNARRHFRVGVKLYRDTNYPGALAEFEAAYRDKPGPGSLQNVALCLKALFRYAEAATTLRLLLERHGAELSDAERGAMQEAVAELEGLIGTLRLEVNPPESNVSVDGRPIAREELARGISLNVGEHTLVAEARGYERRAQIVRIASLQHVEQRLELKATAGFISVVTSDPKAAIAIDDEPLGYHSYRGPVAPDVEHVVQVYRPGFETFEKVLRVELGQTVEINAELGEKTGVEEEPAELPKKPAAPPPARKPVGYYALATVAAVGLNDTPLNLRVEGASGLTLPSFGVRGGYRISEPVAVELAIDLGRLKAEDACQFDAMTDQCVAKRDFSLRSLRFGPNLRLMTHGEMLRFATSVGAGITSHELSLSAEADRAGGSASSLDPYFSLELGAAFNYKHFLAELGVIAYIEGATGLHGAFDANTERAVFSSGTLPMLGVVLKLGYSAWAPRN
ncbi:MAG: PEGA domain-containing protein [Polyangiaceae bacterium]